MKKESSFRERRKGLLMRRGRKSMARTLDEWIACRRARFYRDFLAKSGRPANTPLFDCDHFEATERGAHALLRLVLEGRKRAASSARCFGNSFV